MAQIRNVSGQALEVPGHGEIADDEVFEVPDGEVYAYTASDNFDPVDTAADEAHAAGRAAEETAVEAERLARGVPEPDADPGYEGKPPPAKEVIDVIAEAPADAVRAVLAAENALAQPRVTVTEAAEKRLADLAQA